MRFLKSLKPLILNRLKASQLLLNRSDTPGSLQAFNFTKIISNLLAESHRKRVSREIYDFLLIKYFTPHPNPLPASQGEGIRMNFLFYFKEKNCCDFLKNYSIFLYFND